MFRWYVPFVVGVGAGLAVAYSDAIPFSVGVCSGVLIEHTQPGIYNNIVHLGGYVKNRLMTLSAHEAHDQAVCTGTHQERPRTTVTCALPDDDHLEKK